MRMRGGDIASGAEEEDGGGDAGVGEGVFRGDRSRKVIYS